MEFVSKPDMVAAALHELIIAGEFESGMRLRQRELAERFGVSLTPVREALRRLESEGLVEYDVHRGATVAGTIFTPTEENFQVRAALEPLAAGLAALRITPDELIELREINDQLRARPTRDSTAQQLNSRFHFRIYEACKSPLLLALIRLLWRSLTPRITRPLGISVRQHDDIVAALERGSRAETEEAVRNHVMSLLEYRTIEDAGATSDEAEEGRAPASADAGGIVSTSHSESG